MSVDTPESVTVDSFRTVKNAMSELRAECAGFESFVVGMLDVLEEMRVELAERERNLEMERQGVDQQHSELESLRDQLKEASQNDEADYDTEIAALREQLKETEGALENQQRLASKTEKEKDGFLDRLEELKSLQARLENERNQMREERDKAVKELESVSNAVTQLEEYGKQLNKTRDELDSVRNELTDTHQKLEAARNDSRRLGDPESTDFEEEREALEAELEQARRRAAELSNTIAEQKRQLSEERNGWSDELRQLRTLLESRATVAPVAQPLGTAAAVPAQPQAPAGTANSDPVVGSVLAQFAQLQKDAAARRAKK